MPSWIRSAVFCGLGLAALVLIPARATAQVRVGVFIGAPVVAAPVVVAPRVVAPFAPYYPPYGPYYSPYAYAYPYWGGYYGLSFSYDRRYAPRSYVHRGGVRRR